MFFVQLIAGLIIAYCIYKICEIFIIEYKVWEIVSTYRQQYKEVEKVTWKNKVKQPKIKNKQSDYIAVIDSKDNFEGYPISIGIVIINSNTYDIQHAQYYLLPESLVVDGMFNSLVETHHVYQTYFGTLTYVENHIRTLLKRFNITSIYAYNARFVFNVLPGLQRYDWYDIMPVANNKYDNKLLPESEEYRGDGTLKYLCGVHSILSKITNMSVRCSYHAMYDALDVVKLIKCMSVPVDILNKYPIFIDKHRIKQKRA